MREKQLSSPSEIAFSGWKKILLNVKEQISKDNVSIISAGVAFYSFLAIFPAIAALVSVYGLVSDPQQMQDQLSQLSQMMPQEAYQIISSQLQKLSSSSSTTLGWSVAISILLSVWSANKGMKSLFTGIEVAYYSNSNRGFLKENALTLSFTFFAILLLILSMILVVAFPALVKQLGLASGIEALIRWSRWLFLALLLIYFLGKIYQFAPSRDLSGFSWVIPGALVATVLWLIASWGFSFYVSNFGSYGEMYGSISAVVVMLLWLFLTCFIVLLGAEINSETERLGGVSSSGA